MAGASAPSFHHSIESKELFIMTKIYSNGTADIVLAANDKIAVFSNSVLKLYQLVGYPNHPSSWDLIHSTTAGDTYTSSAFASGATIRVEASASDAFYEIGAAPVIGDPTADISAADATFTVTGLAAAQGGSVTTIGGTSSTAGNAGGAVVMRGGVPGATGVGGAASLVGGAGGSTSGKGGAANVTGGAGTAGNASGGSLVLTPGAKNGSGLDGGVFNRGTFNMLKMATPATATDTATLTDAQMVNGVIVATPTAAAAYTMRTGTQLKAALPTDLAADDAFDMIIINLGGTGDDITLTASTDITIVGDPVVGPVADVATEQSSVGRFRLRFVSGVTFVAYRIG
jgi:hypothetical protein